MECAFLVPADLPGPSGGNNYNQAMLEHLAAAGHRVREIQVPGTWPRPEPEHRRALAEALVGHPTVLVDGIIALAAPELVVAATDAKVAVHILLHSCLTADVGLDATEHAEFAAAERAAVQAAHTVVCTSHWAARDLRNRHQIAEPPVVSPGTDSAALARGSSPPQLLVLAALSPVKNQLMALDALSTVTDLPWTVRLVGAPVDPEYARMLRHTAGRDFAPGRVIFPGARTGRELDEIWDRTDLLVLTSLTETFGMVVTEALARGIPGVVSAGTGAVEALVGSETDGSMPTEPVPSTRLRDSPTPMGMPGALVDPRDPSALAATLRCWLAEPELRADWAAAARDRRTGLRTWQKAAAEMWAILDR